MSVILELAIIPLDKDALLSRCVARTVALIRESGLPHHFGPMSACIEGEWDELMALLTRCFKELERDYNHMHMDMHVSWRAGEKGRLSNMERLCR